MDLSYDYKQNFADSVIDLQIKDIQKAQLGFAANQCDAIRQVVRNLCVDGINFLELFDDDQSAKFIHFINVVGNE